MIKVKHIETWGFEHAIRGMRNPMNSWAKSDSFWCDDCCGEKCPTCRFATDLNDFVCEPPECGYIVGENDMDLMQRLYIGGSEHRKFLRQIFVSMDIVAPDYWFKEFATYRIGVTENSTSTMHKLTSKPITEEDFSIDEDMLIHFADTIVECEKLRELYLETKEQKYWRALIQLLPMGYNYRRTVTMNYENVVNMIHQREFHKLKEWNDFVKILKRLPYIDEIMNREK